MFRANSLSYVELITRCDVQLLGRIFDYNLEDCVIIVV